MYSFLGKAGRDNRDNDNSRISCWGVYILGYENIAEKIDKFLEEKAAGIEEVMDIKLSTSPLRSSDDIDNQMIVTVLTHYKEVNDQAQKLISKALSTSEKRDFWE